MIDKIGYIIFSDGYDANGNPIHKQEFVTYKSKCEELMKINQELKQQLAEKDAELEKWSTQYARAYVVRQNDLIAENQALKQQLAEKEEQLNSSQVGEEFALKCCDEVRNLLELQVSGQHQDKINFAIEQLEKVKELFESCWDYEFDIGELCDKELFYNKIDNQIEELKKEMK